MGRADVITIARQYGSGGADLAKALGARLGWPVLEREIIRAAAERLHAKEHDLELVDEYAKTALDRIGAVISLGLPEYAPTGPTYEVDPDHLAKVEHAVIRAAAETPPLILVGHGAQCLLRKRPATFHVKVVAPAEQRARAIAQRKAIALAAAQDEVRRRDKERERYLLHHFGCDTNDPMLYGIQVNTAFVSIDEAASAIVALVTAPARPSAPP
jgi:cytidylate kinase